MDETADIRKAAQDIVNGCTFDNNLPCIAEKEIVAVDSIADELMHYMISEQGCYLISREEQDRLVNTVLTPKGLNRKCVGRSARVLLSMIGIDAPSNIRCIVFEGEKEHPLISEELMMPILGLVRAKDFDDAVEKAVWLEHGNRHSAHIHSKNIDNITKYARAIDTAILVKKRAFLCGAGLRRRGLLHLHHREQNRRGPDQRQHLHQEKALRHVGQSCASDETRPQLRRKRKRYGNQRSKHRRDRQTGLKQHGGGEDGPPLPRLRREPEPSPGRRAWPC